MPRPLIPDTASRACIPASLQPCNQLEKECYASLPRGTVTDVAAEHSVSHNEPLEIMMRNRLSGAQIAHVTLISRSSYALPRR
jgi:hypothetical protein